MSRTVELTSRVLNLAGGYTKLRPSGAGLSITLCVFIVFSTAQVDAGRRVFISSQSPQQEDRFKSDGPLTLEVLFDDKGKPLMVEDQKHQLRAVQAHWGWWTGPDGSKVARYSVDLISPEFASEYLRKKLVNAQILKRASRADAKGNVIGERILAVLYSPSDPRNVDQKDPHKHLPAAICTSGTLYCEISSDSLDDVLAFEKSSHNDCR